MRERENRNPDEGRDQALDPHRREEVRDATAEFGERLRERGVLLKGDETSEQVVELVDAVERFERAVEARGGDLMVDTAPAREPDDPAFVLPMRRAHESVGEYLARIRDATRALRDRERRGAGGAV